MLEGRELATQDFVRACPGMPMPSVYSKIRALVVSGRISRSGRGTYIPTRKPVFQYKVSPWMQEVKDYLIGECEGISFCISQRNDNLYIEVSKSDVPALKSCLEQHYTKVVEIKEYNRFQARLDGYIIVGHMVSDAPVLEESGVMVPTVEKDLVDRLCSKKETAESIKRYFQKTLEVYAVNRNRLKRYASRRGKAEELSACLNSLNTSRLELFSAVQCYLASVPITRAWVFGSFARGEETPESDLDLLVEYEKGAGLSLLDIIRIKNKLEKIIHKEVDLVADGSLKPFAVASADKDKYLIYER